MGRNFINPKNKGNFAEKKAPPQASRQTTFRPGRLGDRCNTTLKRGPKVLDKPSLKFLQRSRKDLRNTTSGGQCPRLKVEGMKKSFIEIVGVIRVGGLGGKKEGVARRLTQTRMEREGEGRWVRNVCPNAAERKSLLWRGRW